MSVLTFFLSWVVITCIHSNDRVIVPCLRNYWRWRWMLMTIKVVLMVSVNESLASINYSTIHNNRFCLRSGFRRNCSEGWRLITHLQFWTVLRFLNRLKIVAFPTSNVWRTNYLYSLHEALTLRKANYRIFFENSWLRIYSKSRWILIWFYFNWTSLLLCVATVLGQVYFFIFIYFRLLNANCF